MENKSNEATILRPEGDRILNAPLLKMDLNKFIDQLKQEITWAESDHNSITVFKSDYMTIVLIGMHKNTELKKDVIKEEILALKQSPNWSKDILVGSPSLIVALMKLNLIDEYQFSVQPTIVGNGLPLFKTFRIESTLNS